MFSDPVYWAGLAVLVVATMAELESMWNPLPVFAALLVASILLGRWVGARARRRERDEDG